MPTQPDTLTCQGLDRASTLAYVDMTKMATVVSGDVAWGLGLDPDLYAQPSTEHTDALLAPALLGAVNSASVRYGHLEITERRLLEVVAAATAAGRFEPVTLHSYPQGRLVLRDGLHRYLAARSMGMGHLPAHVHFGVPDADEVGGFAFPTDTRW